MSYHVKLSTAPKILKIKSNPNRYGKIKTVTFYEKKDNMYALPFFFGRKLMRVKPLKMCEEKNNVTFMGKLRIEQISVVKEAIYFMNASNAVLLALKPGFGKTVISVCLTSIFLKCKVLVLVKAKTLVSQWFNSYTKFSNSKVSIVPSASCSNKIKREFDEIINMCDVIVCMYKRVDRIPLEALKAVDILIVDEADQFCSVDKVHSLLISQPSYVICCTATPNRSDNMCQMLRCMCGYNEVSRNEADPNLMITMIQTPYEPEIEYDRNGDIMWSTMVSSLLMNEERNNMIANLIIECVTVNNDKVLVLTDRKFNPEILKNAILEKNDIITVSEMYGSMDTYHNADVLIATKSKLGRGFDEQTFCPDYDGIRLNVLIIAISVKSSTSLTQFIGRIQRSSNPKVYFLVDDHSIHRKHWRLCKEYYEQREARIYEIETQ
uniref:A18-like helicase n=1 Tax=Pithovirus LCPAC401 TaxID=2506595 RepID=A0A481ZB12_9VIRU|nr:MAG: A18-like helicase [Pithovirus LCPAC401]